MKNLIFVLSLGILAACSSKVDNPESNEEIKNQISEYKKQVDDLNIKITELQKQLKDEPAQVSYKIPVSVKDLRYEPFNHYIEVNGTVEAIHAALISPEINGQVQKIYIQEGARVKKGQRLFKLNSSITENSIKEIETALELAKTVYERQKRLYDKDIGSELDYLTAKNNKESLESKLKTLQAQADMALVKSPIDGIVDNIFIKKGEMAIPGMQAMQVVNLDDLYVNADVSEAYLTKVKKGDMVLLEFPSYPDIKMEVPVYRTGNVVKASNRTFNVQLKIKNIDEEIKSNVMAQIKINDFSKEKAFLVPSIIIKQDLKGSYIYLAQKNSSVFKAMKVYIKTGISYSDETMITEGLEAGDRVIVKGYNQVSDGAEVEIK
jgi:RND family efflux transporter MFP subunit